MMLATNLVFLFIGVILGMLTMSRIIDFMCDIRILKMTIYNCSTGEITTLGSIDTEYYED